MSLKKPCWARLAKLFVSPGPIYEPEGTGDDWWRTARALHAAGVRAGDLVINTLAYHFVPAGSMFESGARAIGACVDSSLCEAGLTPPLNLKRVAINGPSPRPLPEEGGDAGSPLCGSG